MHNRVMRSKFALDTSIAPYFERNIIQNVKCKNDFLHQIIKTYDLHIK